MAGFVVTGDTLMHAGREYAVGAEVDLDPDLGAVLVEKGRVSVEAPAKAAAQDADTKPAPAKKPRGKKADTTPDEE